MRNTMRDEFEREFMQNTYLEKMPERTGEFYQYDPAEIAWQWYKKGWKAKQDQELKKATERFNHLLER